MASPSVRASEESASSEDGVAARKSIFGRGRRSRRSSVLATSNSWSDTTRNNEQDGKGTSRLSYQVAGKRISAIRTNGQTQQNDISNGILAIDPRLPMREVEQLMHRFAPEDADDDMP